MTSREDYVKILQAPLKEWNFEIDIIRADVQLAKK
jgi:hypothetical protein